MIKKTALQNGFQVKKLIYSKIYFYVTAGFTKSYTLTNKPNAIAIGWNTHDYSYWETRQAITPVYTKSVVIKRKPKKSGEYKRKNGRKGKKNE